MKKVIFIISLILFSSQITAEQKFIRDINYEKPPTIEDIALKIIKVIKSIESSGKYNAIGDSGEYGAYQIMKDTWKYWCIIYFGEILEPTIENQDKVALEVVKALLIREHSPKEIASIWNCGSPKWDGKIGVNKYGVNYNVPMYVNKFIKRYERV